MILTTGPPRTQVPKNRRVQESKLLADWDAAGGFSSVLFWERMFAYSIP